MNIESVALTAVILDPANARKHASKNLEAIKGSLAKFGQQKPIVVGKNGVVIAGNGTLEAARALGWDKIDIVRTDLEGTDATAYAIADNRTGELAEWDAGVLSETLKALQDMDFDLGSIGFDEDDLAAMVATKEPEGLTDPDAVPEDVETRCKPGDLWVLGEHRLLCGDSTNVQHVDRLMGGEKADMVFTDPPYSRDYASRGDKAECVKAGTFADIMQAVALAVKASGGAWYVKLPWYDAVEAIPLLSPKNFIVWAKRGFGMGGGDFRTQHEVLLYGREGGVCNAGKDVGDVWEFAVPFRGRMLHVAETPCALIEQAISFSSKPGQLVQELFLGSGTTLIAAERKNRRCFGLELDAKYCDVILARWEQFTGKTATLEPVGKPKSANRKKTV